MIFAIPAALTYTYGRMARDQRHGWAIWGAMAVLFFAGVAVCYSAEAQRQPGAGRPARRPERSATWRARRCASASPASALFATVTTDASCGAVNAMHDSFTPLGGLVPLANIQLGEVIFGGVGRGPLRDAGLRRPHRVHRRPDGRPHARVPGQEDRGARDEARDALRAHLPAGHPGLHGLERRSRPTAPSSLNNAGPHGLIGDPLRVLERRRQQRLGVRGPQRQHALVQRHARPRPCSSGRFLDDRPGLGIAGSMVGKKVVPPGPGTFPTNGSLVRRAAGVASSSSSAR